MGGVAHRTACLIKKARGATAITVAPRTVTVELNTTFRISPANPRIKSAKRSALSMPSPPICPMAKVCRRTSTTASSGT